MSFFKKDKTKISRNSLKKKNRLNRLNLNEARAVIQLRKPAYSYTTKLQFLTRIATLADNKHSA